MSTAFCSTCNKHWELDADVGAGRCGHCQGIVFRETAGPLVLLAVADEALCLQAGELLLQAGMAVVAAQSAKTIFPLLEHRPVMVMVLDVALPDMLAIELLEQLRKHNITEAVKVLLLTSSYSKVAYKRPPTALYGADAWLEIQHIPAQLLGKVQDLLQRAEQAAQHQQKSEIGLGHTEQLRKLALAQSIAADIAMTHPQAVWLWSKGNGGTPALRQAIQDGVALLQTMAGNNIELETVTIALQELVERAERNLVSRDLTSTSRN